MIDKFSSKYPELKIIRSDDMQFASYGRRLQFSLTDENKLLKGRDYMVQKTLVPEEGNIYVASDKALEALEFRHVLEEIFGGVDIQCGYCNGNNTKLNAFEYHKSSEVLMAVTSCILLLGKPEDLKTEYDEKGQLINATYQTKDCIGLYLEEDEIIELYPRVLHFSPIKVTDSGFKTMIVLPKTTNTPLQEPSEDKLLFMKNKWMVAHEERPDLLEKGAYHGLKGVNYNLD